jgi:hypothetical protein
MKQVLAVLLFFSLGMQTLKAQNNEIRPAAIGVSFFFNDFITPQRIRYSETRAGRILKRWHLALPSAILRA